MTQTQDIDTQVPDIDTLDMVNLYKVYRKIPQATGFLGVKKTLCPLPVSIKKYICPPPF